jgi:hypothetical protein
MATSGNKSLENVFNSLEGNYLDKNEHQLVISPSDKGSPYERAMLTVNLGATDEQLITDFGEWLKTHRSITNYKIREKRFTSKDFSKWISHKVLPYLDLSLIADAENKLLTQNLLGRMLFPDEYNVDLTERIRRSVKPLAEWLLDKKTIQALSFQVRATKKSL